MARAAITELTRRYLRRDPDGVTYARVESLLEIPMFLLSLVLVPAILGPIVFSLSHEATIALELLGLVIWFAFAIEFLWLFLVAPDRRHMVRTHKLDLALVEDVADVLADVGFRGLK